MTSSLNQIENFLAQKRIALVGVSRDRKDFSATLFADLCRYGYEMIPVNPGASEVQGQRCYARVQEIQPAVEAVLLMTAPAVTAKVVRDCAEAGVRRVWIYGPGSIDTKNNEAIAFCQEKGIEVIAGECPYMFLRQAPWFHRVHGVVQKIVGRWPKRAAA